MFFTSLSACKEISHCSVVGCEKTLEGQWEGKKSNIGQVKIEKNNNYIVNDKGQVYLELLLPLGNNDMSHGEQWNSFKDCANACNSLCFL